MIVAVAADSIGLASQVTLPDGHHGRKSAPSLANASAPATSLGKRPGVVWGVGPRLLARVSIAIKSHFRRLAEKLSGRPIKFWRRLPKNPGRV